jgi:Molybdopterin cofactor-binding domain
LTQRIYHPSRARSAVSDRCPDHGRLRLPECPRTLRLVSVIDGGRILNEKTARSQIIGATAMAIGMTLLEETVFDPGTGRIANVTFADYLVPVQEPGLVTGCCGCCIASVMRPGVRALGGWPTGQARGHG